MRDVTDDAPFTPRQARFIEEFPVDLSVGGAAIRAGFAPKSASEHGSRLLADVRIQNAIAAQLHARSLRTQITQDQVIREYARIGFSDIRRVMRWGNAISTMDSVTGEERLSNGIALIASEDLDLDTAASISEVSQTKDGTLKVRMHSKTNALDSLARHLGMFKDTSPDDGFGDADAARRKKIRQQILCELFELAKPEALTIEGDR